MPDGTSVKSDVLHKVGDTGASSAMTLRVPKPNMQVVVLGLVAFITLFQTIQLLRISAKASAVQIKATTPTTTTTTGDSGSNTNVPQSMVGGC